RLTDCYEAGRGVPASVERAEFYAGVSAAFAESAAAGGPASAAAPAPLSPVVAGMNILRQKLHVMRKRSASAAAGLTSAAAAAAAAAAELSSSNTAATAAVGDATEADSASTSSGSRRGLFSGLRKARSRSRVWDPPPPAEVELSAFDWHLNQGRRKAFAFQP
ncbi:hypothetical protein HK405_015189, partial [Cladochytrium tenue]